MSQPNSSTESTLGSLSHGPLLAFKTFDLAFILLQDEWQALDKLSGTPHLELFGQTSPPTC